MIDDLKDVENGTIIKIYVSRIDYEFVLDVRSKYKLLEVGCFSLDLDFDGSVRVLGSRDNYLKNICTNYLLRIEKNWYLYENRTRDEMFLIIANELKLHEK